MTETLVAIAMLLFPSFQPGSQTEPFALWSCDAERWVTPPVLDDGVFTGHLFSDCSFSEARGGGLVALDRMFLDQVIASQKVHGGPYRETYDGLPSVRYDVTVKNGDESDSITMRQDAHVATDRVQRSVYATLSRKVEGEGMADYIRRVNIRIEILAGAVPGEYRLRASNLIQVDKPWFLPGGTFRSRAEKAHREQFVKVRDRMVAQIAGKL